MEFGDFDINGFGLGIAKFRIVNESADTLKKLILVDCNEVYIKLTGLESFKGSCILDYAFEQHAADNFIDYREFLINSERDNCMHYFYPSKKWLFSILLKGSYENELHWCVLI